MFPMQLKFDDGDSGGDNDSNDNRPQIKLPPKKPPMKPVLKKVNNPDSLLAVAQTSAEENTDPEEAGSKLQHVRIEIIFIMIFCVKSLF